MEEQIKNIEEIKVLYLKKSEKWFDHKYVATIDLKIKKIDKNTRALIDDEIYFYSNIEELEPYYYDRSIKYITYKNRGILEDLLKEMKKNNYFDYICIDENLKVNKKIRETYQEF